jgi:hypothetical protein
MTYKTTILATACAIAIVFAFIFLDAKIKIAETAADKYKANTEALLTEIEQYKVRDSLSAARVESLELTVREFERFRAEDAALIKELQRRNRDLAQVSKAQAETIIELQAAPRDTVIITRDSIRVPAVAVHCGDAWYDFDGWLTEDAFTGVLKNRDSIVLAETVKYRRFLGFLWKTKRIDERTLQAVSRNPHTVIENLEHILIEN